MIETICEIWKPIKGYEGIYEISNYGRVKRLARSYTCRQWQGGTSHYRLKEMYIKARISNVGYERVGLYKRVNGKLSASYKSVHRLVAEHFIDNPNHYPCVNHLDCNRLNNKVDNLEWCTASHNNRYSYVMGTRIPPHMKQIAQLDLKGNVIAKWDSIAEASRRCGIVKANIGKVLHGERSQAGGFRWAFVEQKSR